MSHSCLRPGDNKEPPTISVSRQPTVETLHKITLSYDETTEKPDEALELVLEYLKEKVKEGRTKFYIRVKSKGKEENKEKEKEKEKEEEEEEEAEAEAEEPSRKKQKTIATTTTTTNTQLLQSLPVDAKDFCWPCLVCTKLNLLESDRCESCAVRIPECWKKAKLPVAEIPSRYPSENNDSEGCPICTYHMADDSQVPLTHLLRGRYTNADCKHSVCIPCLFRMEMSSGSSPSDGSLLKCPVCRRDWDAALPFLVNTRRSLLANKHLFDHLDPAPFKSVRRAVNSGKATKECAEAFSNSLANVTFIRQLPTVVSIEKVRDGFGLSQNYLTECHRCSVELARMAAKSENRRKFQLLPCGHSICVRCVTKEGIYSDDGSTILSCNVPDCSMAHKQFRFSIKPRLNNDLDERSSDSPSSSSSVFGGVNNPLLSFFGPPSASRDNPFGVPPYYRRNRTSAPFSFGSTLTIFDGSSGVRDLANVLTLARNSLDFASEENAPPTNTAATPVSTTEVDGTQ